MKVIHVFCYAACLFVIGVSATLYCGRYEAAMTLAIGLCLGIAYS